MTENSFQAADAGDAPKVSKPVMIAGAVAAVAALGFGGMTLLGGGGDDTADTGYTSTVTRTRSAGTTSTATTKVTKPTTVPATSQVRLGKDPFLALYVKPVAAAAAPAKGVGTSTTTGGTTTGGSTTTTGGTSAPSTPSKPVTTPSTPTAPAATTHALKLTRVYGTGKDQTAQFTIDGKTQLAKAGSVFGPTSELKLLSLQQDAKGVWTAVLQVGDGQPFDAATGQTLYVR